MRLRTIGSSDYHVTSKPIEPPAQLSASTEPTEFLGGTADVRPPRSRAKESPRQSRRSRLRYGVWTQAGSRPV